MFLITYHVKPLRAHPEAPLIGGAYVNSYVEAASIEEAESIAKNQIEILHWLILEKDQALIVRSEDFDDNDPGQKYFEQALTEKVVLVFHTYPRSEQAN